MCHAKMYKPRLSFYASRVKEFLIVPDFFLPPLQDVELWNSCFHRGKKSPHLHHGLVGTNRKNDLMILASQIIQAVSELYHNKGAAMGAAFRLLRRSFALVGVAGCAWRSSKKVNKCL